ncbi:ankyrin [Lentithecium fluviatile CBS 122367]|uniref:Ankyrin n=1 Tax=Lentithecium fluviatile CBS 122367 TaxID=1168545 RepID=A0A6G1J8G4_9PLEO|nr:ankyrin [Lentithecium fluviatile CBS 122367]
MSSLFSSTFDANVPIRAFISNISGTDPSLSSVLDVFSGAKSDHGYGLAISSFAVLLRKLDVQGPCSTVSKPEYIASGAQFDVYKTDIHFEKDQGALTPAAIKFPKFLTDAKSKLDLSKPAVARQVKELVIEISALRHPKLRNHRSIVDLFGWGLDDRNSHETPFLALEIAHGDLDWLLNTKPDLSTAERVWLLEDVAHGLDAIHERSRRAKLSDFGGGVDLNEETALHGRGTVGWRAPELKKHQDHGDPLDSQLLHSLDTYSYGLLIWVLLCRLQGPPPAGEEPDVVSTVEEDFSTYTEYIPEKLLGALISVLKQCLHHNPAQRIIKLGLVLDSIFWPHRSKPAPSSHVVDLREPGSFPEEERNETTIRLDGMSIGKSAVEVAHAWQLPDIDSAISEHIERALVSDPTSITPELAFTTFLKQAEGGPLLLYNHARRDDVLSILRAAATKGFAPARALFFRVLDFFGLNDSELGHERIEWLFSCLASGATFLESEARALDEGECERSLQTFRSVGGFNSHYSGVSVQLLHDKIIQSRSAAGTPFVEDSNAEKVSDPIDVRSLHVLCSFDDRKALDTLPNLVSRDNVNTLNDHGETPLYRACMAGASRTVDLLLSLGADASIRPSPTSPTCLHWLFIFRPASVDEIARSLVQHGALVDACCSESIGMMYYPFVLPLGTPMHWAVEFSSHFAIAALLALGADRGLGSLVNSGPHWKDEIEKHPAMVLDSIETATANWENKALGLLLSHRDSSTLQNSKDEGIGASHLLNGKIWLQITPTTLFYVRFVRGESNRQSLQVQKTANLLVDHGFRFNSLLGPEKSTKETTPLIFAAKTADTAVVQALLDVGANVNGKDSPGRTALMSTEHLFYSVAPAMQVEVINLVLAHNPEVNIEDNQGFTAVLLAARARCIEPVNLLLRHGADPSRRISYHCAAEYGLNAIALLRTCSAAERIEHDLGIARILREHIQPRLVDKEGQPISITDHEVNVGNLQGSTLLHFMASYCHLESCSALLDMGADVNSLKPAAGFYNKD